MSVCLLTCIFMNIPNKCLLRTILGMVNTDRCFCPREVDILLQKTFLRMRCFLFFSKEGDYKYLKECSQFRNRSKEKESLNIMRPLAFTLSYVLT